MSIDAVNEQSIRSVLVAKNIDVIKEIMFVLKKEDDM